MKRQKQTGLKRKNTNWQPKGFEKIYGKLYRPEWFDKLAHGRNLLQIALDVHMTNSGSCERSVIDQADDLRLLKYAVSTWKNDGICVFDDAVKHLLEVTLQESGEGPAQ